MSYEFSQFAQQGWQCPICKRVYSPLTPVCMYCSNKEVTKSSTITITKESDDKCPCDSCESNKGGTVCTLCICSKLNTWRNKNVVVSATN